MAAKKKKTLEQQFHDAVAAVESKLAKAEKAYAEADDLATKHGITLSMNYRDFRTSDVIGIGYDEFFSDKWDSLDRDLMSELTGVGDCDGWMHSSC